MKPTRSANSTLTTRRCAPALVDGAAGDPLGWAVAASNEVPQLPQNLLPGRLVAAQAGQAAVKGAPQSVQNLPSASFAVPHSVQTMPAPHPVNGSV